MKSVKDYAFSPEKLLMLELEIDRVANTHRWIHGVDDLKDWELVGTDVYERTKPGMTLAMQSAGLGHTDILQNEHDGGADIDAQDDTGWTALMLAAEKC
jgi:ankyrin repeat protein